jgi:hypothetical protein
MKTSRARRPGVKVTAGLVVEGDTEFAALPLLYRKSLLLGCPPMRAINLGGVGSDLEPIGIAKMVKPKVVQHQAAGRNPIIVCIDREQRAVTASELAVQLLAAIDLLLRAESRSSTGVAVVIADRAFEAWILADARGLHTRQLFARAPSFHSFEGELGKQKKKGVVEMGELLGRPYGKTADGPRLFEKLQFSVARKHAPNDHGSRSLHRFLVALGV